MQINRNMGWDEIKGSFLINDKAGWNIYSSLSLSPRLLAYAQGCTPQAKPQMEDESAHFPTPGAA